MCQQRRHDPPISDNIRYMCIILYGYFLPRVCGDCHPDPDRLRVHASAAHSWPACADRSAYNGNEVDAIVDYIQFHDAAKDEWYKIDPRHQEIHLLPANAKYMLCGIPYTYGTYLP